MPKNCTAQLWNFYDKIPEKKAATCRLCNNVYSFLTTTANLKCHLQRVHSDVYYRINWDGSAGNEDDAAEELLKVTDIWSYFDTSAGRKAKCIVCKTTLENEYDELKAHLKDNHPKLLLQILQDNDQKSEAGSNNDDDGDENAYTEVVYLEQDPAIENVIKIKEKPKSYPKPIKKRERPVSFHTEEIPAKIAKEDDELETFIKYIRVLLKKLPEDVFSNVQAEIINTILKAQASSNSANTSRSLNTSYNTITVDGITPVANTISVGQNYTITVAPPSTTDNEEEKVDS